MREGILYPPFSEKFFRLDFDAPLMPVLCLYPIPSPIGLDELRLGVCGLEQHPRRIPWSALKELPRVTLRVPLICQIFNWSEVVEWEGVRLVDVLDFMKVETHPEGYYAIYSRDGVYFETLSRDEARDPRVLLAYAVNGGPLPEQHGGPLRLVVPFLQGYKSVKWADAIRAFRHDPVGIKQLLGQSPTGQLNDAWRKRFDLQPPPGRAGDPPPRRAEGEQYKGSDLPGRAEGEQYREGGVLHGQVAATAPSRRAATPASRLCEVIAILRPANHIATRRALDAAGFGGYTTFSVLGRSRQRGLKFSGEGAEEQEVTIKFLPKQFFTIVVEAHRVAAVAQALIQANRTGKGQYGDGKIFVVDLEETVRISTDEHGKEAV